MDRHVAFLRGVNLGAKRRVSGEQLRAIFADVGFEEVATFRASGNVVFDAGDTKGEEGIVTRTEAGLGEALDFEVRVVLRSQREVAAIAAREPFDADVVATTEGRLQVLLLAQKPSASVRKRVLALATDDDRLAIHGRELYWLPRAGMSNSELDLGTVEAQLGLATMRTKGTIEQIAAKYF
ncbi:MAG TPA: DUF1697 domain-containing protein [Solirubrobacterales bacterium]|nr:DUF1697 domain-containing protein [Solirubrobacterales bacterium]